MLPLHLTLLTATTNPPILLMMLSPFHRPQAYSNASIRSNTQARHTHWLKDASFAPISFRRTDFTSKLCYYHTRFGPAAKKCEKPCAWSKKVVRSPPSVVASVSTNVFFVLDSLTGIRFLIDIGACRSLLPKSMVHSGCSPGADTHLIAANGSHIITYGYKTLQLSFTGSTFRW